MPLSQQLKSEMTGFPTEMLPQKEDESHVAESGKMSDFNKSKSSEIPPLEECTNSSTEAHLPSPDHMALLLSIESQLKGLSDNIHSLGKAVSDIKSPDYRAVFYPMMNRSIPQTRHPYCMIVGFHPKDSFCAALKQMPTSNFVIIDGDNGLLLC